jgi:CheY-like chemotaxis protein
METKSSVLLVDNEPDLLDNLSLTLETAGYRTLIAGDGFEALDVLKTQPVDLILSDVAMPYLDGYQLYRRVRGNSEWDNIPFLFLTGCNSEQLLLVIMSKLTGRVSNVDLEYLKPSLD